MRANARVMPRARSSLTRPSLMIRATRLSASVSASVNIASSSSTFWKPIACQNRRAVDRFDAGALGHLATPHRGRPAEQHPLDPLGHVVRGVVGGQADILRGHPASSPETSA